MKNLNQNIRMCRVPCSTTPNTVKSSSSFSRGGELGTVKRKGQLCGTSKRLDWYWCSNRRNSNATLNVVCQKGTLKATHLNVAWYFQKAGEYKMVVIRIGEQKRLHQHGQLGLHRVMPMSDPLAWVYTHSIYTWLSRHTGISFHQLLTADRLQLLP